MDINVREVIDRIKVAIDLTTDIDLARYFEVSNKTISSWRLRNSIPIEAVIQASWTSGKPVDYFLFGEQQLRAYNYKYIAKDGDDRTIRDFKYAGYNILVSILQKYAEETLLSLDEEDLKTEGDGFGMSFAMYLDIISAERKALLDTGKMDIDAFDEYVRKLCRTDLPLVARAFKHRT